MDRLRSAPIAPFINPTSMSSGVAERVDNGRSRRANVSQDFWIFLALLEPSDRQQTHLQKRQGPERLADLG